MINRNSGGWLIVRFAYNKNKQLKLVILAKNLLVLLVKLVWLVPKLTIFTKINGIVTFVIDRISKYPKKL